MNTAKEKKYQSGSDVLEKYVPDYVEPETHYIDDDGTGSSNGCLPDKLSDEILSELKSKIDKIHVAKK